MALIDMVAAERVAVADLIDSLDAEQLATQSLCANWTVREVAAHFTAPFEIKTLAFVKGVLTHGFSFDKANADFAKRIAAASTPADISRVIRENAYNPWTPPGSGLEAPLADAVLHGQDIRRPLGLTRDFESETMKVVLSLLTSGKAKTLTSKKLVAGLAFDAPDAGWRGGEGALVRGPAEAMAMVLSGRNVSIEPLSGPGVALLRTRLSG